MIQLRYYFKRKTKQTYKPVILVTGCSSGIGQATAKLLYSLEGYRVVVTARGPSVERLRERFKESERFWVRNLDVTVPEQRSDLIS